MHGGGSADIVPQTVDLFVGARVPSVRAREEVCAVGRTHARPHVGTKGEGAAVRLAVEAAVDHCAASTRRRRWRRALSSADSACKSSPAARSADWNESPPSLNPRPAAAFWHRSSSPPSLLHTHTHTLLPRARALSLAHGAPRTQRWQAEQMRTRPGVEELFLAKRAGFVKVPCMAPNQTMPGHPAADRFRPCLLSAELARRSARRQLAMQSGAALVPCYAFGTVDLYDVTPAQYEANSKGFLWTLSKK